MQLSLSIHPPVHAHTHTRTHTHACMCVCLPRLPHRAPTVPEEDTEHVDAEQLEIESRCTDPDMKPDPHGVGYQLRAYWNATVQEAVEVRFNSVREPGGRLYVCAPCCVCTQGSRCMF